VATVGAAPNRRLVAQWNDAGFYPAPDAATHLTFEVVLSESTQTVEVLYNTMTAATSRGTGASATVGVQESTGTRFDLVGYNTAGVANAGNGFRWAPTTADQTLGGGLKATGGRRSSKSQRQRHWASTDSRP
jgi:hypothetical protein